MRINQTLFGSHFDFLRVVARIALAYMFLFPQTPATSFRSSVGRMHSRIEPFSIPPAMHLNRPTSIYAFGRLRCRDRLVSRAVRDDTLSDAEEVQPTSSSSIAGRRAAMQTHSVVSNFLLDMLLNGSDSSSSLTHRSIINDAYPVLGDAIDVSLPDTFSVGNRPEQPKIIKPTDTVLNLKWINYLRRMQSWLDGEICLLKRAVEARSADLLSDISSGNETGLERKCVSFFKLYELSDALIGSNLTDVLRKAGYGFVVSSNAPLRGPDGRFVSKSAAVASAIPQDKASMQVPLETPKSWDSDIDFINATLSTIGKHTMPSESVDERRSTPADTALAGENFAWYEMKEAGSPIYEEMQKVIGNKALTSSGGTKDIFGALRAEDRDAPPLPPRVGAAGDVESPQRSIGPSNSPDLSGDGDSLPRKRIPAQRKGNWASRWIRRLTPWR